MNEHLEVRGMRRYGSDLFELEVARDGLDFTPGDCMALYAADGRVSRPYSISSGTGEDALRFLFRRMPGGALSEHLAALRPGDRVKTSPPFGWFRPGGRAAVRPFAFFATGTGIAPFLSHLRSRPSAAPAVFHVGVRRGQDLVEREWLSGLCDVRFAVSREDVPGCHRGRITDLLGEVPCSPVWDYYLCGLDAMIEDVSRWLERHGVGIGSIHRECFFNAAFS
jgi:ferredoxin-NADP reductase